MLCMWPRVRWCLRMPYWSAAGVQCSPHPCGSWVGTWCIGAKRCGRRGRTSRRHQGGAWKLQNWWVSGLRGLIVKGGAGQVWLRCMCRLVLLLQLLLLLLLLLLVCDVLLLQWRLAVVLCGVLLLSWHDLRSR